MSAVVLTTLILTILFAVFYDLTNGWNDSANAIATVISTRVLSPAKAIAFGSALNFLGAMVSSAVARTVGHEVADPRFLSGGTFLAAVMTAPLWITWCSRRGLPISCSHALLGALIGSVLASAGAAGLQADGIRKILFGVLISPVAAFIGALILARLVAWVSQSLRPRTASVVFGKLQLVSAGAMAFAHGTGDAQKAMGIISGALLAAGVTHAPVGRDFVIPFWVRIVCASAMAIGTSLGGWHVIRTLGTRLAYLRTYQGFSAETAAAATILVNTLGGIPLSTTHSITGAILGVGAAHGVKAVRWGVGRKIVFAWVVTFPICIIAGNLVHLGLKWIGMG